jgi:Domain of unknown function (DUF4340)
MKLRGIIVAAIILAALTGTLYWSNHHKPAEETSKAAADLPPKILSLSEHDISRLVIRRKGEPEVVLSKNASGAWQITAPQALPADQEAVSSLLSTLSSLNSERVVDDKAGDLSQYDLTDAELQIEVTTKGNTQKLLLGGQTITGGSNFAALAGDPRVFTIANFSKSSLDKSAADLRDKRLLTADFDKVSQIELLQQSAGNKQDITFAHEKDSWQILKPKPYRVESFKVDDLVRALKDAKMETSSSDEGTKIAAAFNGASPLATAKISGASGIQELQVRKAKDDYYAKSSVISGVFKVPASLGTALNKSLDDFRNKKLFDFGYDEPDKIEIHDGVKSYFLTHSGTDWWGADGKKLDSDTVQALLDKLRDLSATKFPDSGFTSQAIEITVVSNQNKRTEKVAIGKSGDSYIAKRQNEPALYELTAAAVSDLQQAAAGLKPAPPPPPAAPSTKKK